MILLYEPQCKGIEHSEVNAAFLIFLTKAEPAEQIVFYGDADHLSAVVNAINLLNYSECISAVKFIPINVPPPKKGLINRISRELNYFLRAAMICRALNENVSKVIILSATSSTLLGVKTVEKQNKIPVFIVLHGVLESITSRPKSYLKRILWFRNFLPLRKDCCITYITLADFIKDNLLSEFPSLEKRVVSFDMPYIFNDDKIQGFHKRLRINAEVSSRLTITSAGVGSIKKGTAEFFDVAGAIYKKYPEAVNFVYAGRLADFELKNKIPTCIKSYIDQDMLSPSKYSEILESTDILIFFYPADAYRFSLSGVLLDAIRYEIPIIAIGNDCFNYCRYRVGRIGWICHDVNEVRSTIEGIINSISFEDLAEIRSNFRRFKNMHTPDHKSARLAEILNHD